MTLPPDIFWTSTALLIILGFVVCLLILGAIGCGILALADKVFERHRIRAAQAQWEKDCANMRSNAMYFSEDAATQQLLINLAEGVDVSAARNAWRKNRGLE
jgi:hypothetical protein